MNASIVALGSGDAFSSAGRHHTCWLIEDEQGACLVDAGGQALAALHRAGCAPETLAAVHFTHLHGDHTAGWPFLLLDGMYRTRRTAPLDVIGPPGTGARLQALWEATYPDTSQKPLGFELRVREVQAGESAHVARRKVVALAARHQAAPHVALSLRLETPQRTLAFTGDTGPHEGLVELARGAAVLISECSELKAGEGTRKHLAWSDLIEWLPRMGVRRVLLGHLGADVRSRSDAIQTEARALDLELSICDDGDRFTL